MIISHIADESDEFIFPNRMNVTITYADDKQIWGSHGRLSGKWRCVQLFDKRGKLLSELVELNPTYYPNLPRLDVSAPEGIIY